MIRFNAIKIACVSLPAIAGILILPNASLAANTRSNQAHSFSFTSPDVVAGCPYAEKMKAGRQCPPSGCRNA